MPAAAAPLDSRVPWTAGMRIELYGYMPAMMATHEGGTTTTVLGPMVLST